MTIPDHVVFDTEPLVAHADDEPGSEVVEEYLDAVAVEDTDGYINYVNLTEVRYILTRKYDRTVADGYLDWLFDLGMTPIDVDAVWMEASEYVIEYNPALGDSFALATAQHVGGTLLVGADDDYDEITEDSIERFREEIT
jgi:predicted nucleic acid-binding protein